MREQIHHETVTPAEWLFCSDGLLPCFRDNETGIRNGPAFFQQARRAPLHGSPLQPACQTAGSPTGRPPRHPQQRSPASQQPPATGGAAPTSRLPRDRSRNGGQTGTAATRRAAVPCALLHKPAGPPRPAVPLHNPPGHHAPPSPCITRRATSARRPSPPGKARTSSPARAAAHARPLHPFCGGATRRAPPSPLRETRTTPPARAAAHARPLHPFCGGATRRAPPSPLWETRTTPPARAAAHARPLHPFCGGATSARRPLPSGKTRTTPPARAAAHARPLHPFCGGSTRRAPPSPLGKREPRPQRAPLRMPDRYIRSVAGPPGARRFAAEGGGRAAENIFFLIPEYHLTTA